ncbi:unnamed protein product [Clonostachys rosea f. rosea IK726]|uniref:Uncharacterized protein n=1 Tax=Clonostachys rosea f. rosea IK726 TaxID=1349383 RepID=A0ACA9TWA8_BIOOC|nr:unnamed protein product [Clonostachys rosea f. rosea IK726]
MPTGARNPNINVQAADLAYITYSSGLTGSPKGVKHTHGDISNMLCSTMCELGCNETDRLLAITTVCSNIAVLELFLPLLCGASIVLARTADVSTPKALLGLMRQYRITTMQATPTIWQILVNQGLQEAPRLMNLICNCEAGGESSLMRGFGLELI